MKNAPALYTVLAVFVVGLIIVSLAFKLQTDRLEDELDIMQNELRVKDTELEIREAQIGHLKTELGALSALAREINSSKIELEKNKDLLEDQLYGIRTEIDNTLDDLNGYEEEIADSMAWFRTNSNLDNFDEWRTISSFLQGWCTERDEEICEIRLACLTFVTDYLEGFHYQFDETTTGKIDFLQDLSQIYDNQGGDCEDYSLLAVAELNYLKDFCAKRGSTEYRYVAFTQDEGSKHFVEDTQKYYIPDATDYDLPEELQNYHIVCGTFPVQFDPNNLDAGVGKIGHCVIGFSDIRVESSADVPDYLESSILIEPQNGRFIRDLREPSIFDIPHDGEEKGEYPISIVITDEDLYLYGDFKGELRWHGYADYVSEIGKLTYSIEELKKG